MKAKPHRVEIKIETHEIKVIRFSRTRPSRFCEKCGKLAHVCLIENAVNAMDLALPELIQLAQVEDVHLVDASDNSVVICGTALGGSKQIEKNQTNKKQEETKQ